MDDPTPILDPPENAPPGDAFYTPPDPLPDGEHGDPIYQRRLDNPVAALGDGNNWLVLYRSEGVHGNPIATSASSCYPQPHHRRRATRSSAGRTAPSALPICAPLLATSRVRRRIP